MQIRRGIEVSPGYAVGPARVFDREQFSVRVKNVEPEAVETEVLRFLVARDKVLEQMNARLKHLPARIRAVAAGIIEGHIAMIGEEGLRQDIEEQIRKHHYTVEYALSRAFRVRLKALEDSGQDSFTQRIRQDFVEIENELMRAVVGREAETLAGLKEPTVVVAHALGPSQIAELGRGKVIGLLTDMYGRSSHVSIIAASLGIPTVVGLESITLDVTTGDLVVVDGSSGTAIVDPDEATLKRYRAMAHNFAVKERELVEKLRDLPAETRDGRRVEIFGNIEYPEEIAHAVEQGAEGIGLYRTEYMFLKRAAQPDEAYHYDQYTKAIRALAGRPMIVRTLDLGADKVALDGYEPEANPLLGTRAIRLCFQRLDIFRAQLRAILRASAVGHVSMMIPFVTSVGEVRRVRELLADLRADLKREGAAMAQTLTVGAMIETPAAVQIADLLARHVDFFSIGTNDLIACSIAVDRSNEHVARLYQPHHPAILRMLRQVIQVGQAADIPVALCGEMSSDLRYTLLLLGLGLRKFSVVPPVIPEIKKLIRSVTTDEARALAEKVMSMDDPDETERFLHEQTSAILPDVL
jgi:phosphotransferase system enzyme I (PtsI)